MKRIAASILFPRLQMKINTAYNRRCNTERKSRDWFRNIDDHLGADAWPDASDCKRISLVSTETGIGVEFFTVLPVLVLGHSNLFFNL